MQYELTLKATFDGEALSDINRAIELLSGIKGLVRGPLTIQPVSQPVIVVEKKPVKKVHEHINGDPRVVFETNAKGKRVLSIDKTLRNLNLTREQLDKIVARHGSIEYSLKRAIAMEVRIRAGTNPSPHK